MPYSNFSFEMVKDVLGIELREKSGLFAHVPELTIAGNFMPELLAENVPLALANNTEKARSELIIMPVLLALRKLESKQISLFSGIEFNVDEERELNGTCDFMISLSAEQLFLNAPIIALVEAKKENILAGIPQCIAEMKAAQLFNERRHEPARRMYGVVTTGSNWKFLTLEAQTVWIDLDEYYIKELGKIMGILHSMCAGN